MQMKIKTKYLVGIIAVVAVVGAVYYVVSISGSSVKPQPGNYDSFAKCLTEKGATMYGAYWCSHCQNQKAMFGDSVKYIKYVECAQGGENANPSLCSQNSITGYPTWIINGQQYQGEQSLQTLSTLTGCSLS
jgi:hypothetical protein